MRIVLFAANASENSIGRVYVLWLLAKQLGWEVATFAKLGNAVWKPLAASEFGSSVRFLRDTSADELAAVLRSSDVLIGCKPRPESAGIAIRLGRKHSKPVVVDLDDPDFEFQFEVVNRARMLRRWARPIRRIRYYALRRGLHKYPLLVSNPVLQGRYGGWVVPHARIDPGTLKSHTSLHPTTAFVGTVLTHKGVDDLRSAFRRLNRSDETEMTLTITAPKPSDAEEWEKWVGLTSLEEGARIVQEADIVVIPSRTGSWADAQLPAKLMDAMLAGRAISVTDVGPLKWAVGDGAEVSSAGDVAALARTLERLKEPALRQKLGKRARKRALELFTIAAVAPIFQEALMQATSQWDPDADSLLGGDCG